MTITTFNKIQNAIDKLQEEVAKLDSPSIAILEQLKNNIEQSKGLVTQLRQEKSFKKDFLNTLIDNREDDLLKLLPYYTAETLPHIVQGSGLKIIIKNKELHDLLSKTLRESNYTRELVPFVNKKLKMFMNSNAFNLSWQNRDDIIFTIKIKNLNEQEVFDVLTYLIEGLQSFYNDLINKLKDFVIFSKNINQVNQYLDVISQKYDYRQKPTQEEIHCVIKKKNNKYFIVIEDSEYLIVEESETFVYATDVKNKDHQALISRYSFRFLKQYL